MTIGQLRQLALGEELTLWSAEQEPILRDRGEQLLSQLGATLAATQQDVLRLELMDCITEAEEQARKDEINRLTAVIERQAATYAKLVSVYHQLSAGGAASIWAAMQRAPVPPAENGNTERNATPARRFGAQRDAQVIDTE